MKQLQQSERKSVPDWRPLHYRFHGTPPKPQADQPTPLWVESTSIAPNWHKPYDKQRESTVEVLLTLEQLSPEQLAPLNRGERYGVLLSHAKAQREQIGQWLVDEGLHGEVIRLGDPNTFNLLFVCTTRRVAQQLHRAPNVVDVAVTER